MHIYTDRFSVCPQLRVLATSWEEATAKGCFKILCMERVLGLFRKYLHLVDFYGTEWYMLVTITYMDPMVVGVNIPMYINIRLRLQDFRPLRFHGGFGISRKLYFVPCGGFQDSNQGSYLSKRL